MPPRDVTMANDEAQRKRLVQLRLITEATGQICDEQALQLRLWPFRIDPRIDAAGVRADVHVASKSVAYAWTIADLDPEWEPDAVYRQRVAYLPGWVRFLLGADWTVSVSLNGRNLTQKNERPKPAAKRRNRAGAKPRRGAARKKRRR